MRTRHSVLALALLIVLSAISGCRQEVSKTPTTLTNPTTIEFELSPSHTPIINVFDNQVLSFRPVSGAVTVTFDQGLCRESGPLPGSHDAPAVCTIAPQTYKDGNPNTYTLTVSGSDGVQYQVDVKHCIGCP
jgi:hypothetical protein